MKDQTKPRFPDHQNVFLRDNINQALALVRLYITMLRPLTAGDNNIKKMSLDLLDIAIEEIRKLTTELTIPLLMNNGLVASIEELIININISGTINVRFEHDRKVISISQGKEVALFRAAQIQLKNILEHSKAKNVIVSLSQPASEVELSIQDDGIGFDPRATTKGIGLLSIRERARFYNGTVDILSATGKGSLLIIRLPL